MSKSRYQQIFDSEWGPLEKEFDLACCHCGLVHHIKIRVRKGTPEIQFVQDGRKTAGMRRGMKVKVVSTDSKGRRV